MPNLLNHQLQAIQTTKTRYKQILAQTENPELEKQLNEKITELNKIEKETLCQINK